MAGATCLDSLGWDIYIYTVDIGTATCKLLDSCSLAILLVQGLRPCKERIASPGASVACTAVATPIVIHDGEAPDPYGARGIASSGVTVEGGRRIGFSFSAPILRAHVVKPFGSAARDSSRISLCVGAPERASRVGRGHPTYTLQVRLDAACQIID